MTDSNRHTIFVSLDNNAVSRQLKIFYVPGTEFRVSGCIDANANGACDSDEVQFTDVWIFNLAQFLGYFWAYANNGLKLMQIRFYVSQSYGSITTGG